MLKLIALEAKPQPDAWGLADTPIGFVLLAWQGDMLVRIHLLPAHTENNAAAFLRDFGWMHKMKADNARARQFIDTILFPRAQWQGDFKNIRMGFYGTPFQQRIMQKMLGIAKGQTKSYGQLDTASRAVGTVCAKNPLPLIVPCHRVTAANGALGHYAFGGALKAQLLRWEGYK